jgi:NAD-dependent dihydropyrimidine dehydrogenase PreA subunit
MVMRKIIEIDESLCDGCGECVVGCAEGALQIVDGKAKMVREDFCDGFGDCVGTCPTGALTIVEREVADYDPIATRDHVAGLRGAEGLAEFDAAAARHAPEPAAQPAPARPPHGGGCPGTRLRVLPTAGAGAAPSSSGRPAARGTPAFPDTVLAPNLGQWPIMLHLVPPQAPFFRDRELCLLSTCSPVAMPDAQWRYVRGRGIAVACPKLDRSEGYVQKLAAILSEPSIPRAVVVRMEVPCCSGLTAMAVQAARLCGREDLQVVEATVGVDGRFLGEKVVFDTAPGA